MPIPNQNRRRKRGDSVIDPKEVLELEAENARLRAVAQAAKLFTSKLQNCLDAQTCNINECYICEHDYEPSIEALKQALTAAGYGGEE